MEEVGEDDVPGPVGTGQSTDQAPLHFDLSSRSNQGQGTRVQASRDQDQQNPGKGRGGDGNRPTGSLEAPTQSRPPGRGEREERNQPPPGYSRQFPVFTRGRTKIEAERSGLDNVIEDKGRGVQQEKGGANRNKPKQYGGEVGKVCGDIQRSGGNASRERARRSLPG